MHYYYQFFLSTMMMALSMTSCRSTVDDEAVLERINMYRSMHNVPPVSFNRNLSAIAMENAKSISSNKNTTIVSKTIGQNVGKVRYNKTHSRIGKRRMDETNITDFTSYIFNAIDSWYS